VIESGTVSLDQHGFVLCSCSVGAGAYFLPKNTL
jgi:hypothetical protein